jgi:hypothetical protein
MFFENNFPHPDPTLEREGKFYFSPFKGRLRGGWVAFEKYILF